MSSHSFPNLFSRLSAKLTLATLFFILGLAIIITVLVVYGFQQTQTEAVQRSREGLEAQGSNALLSLVRSEANVSAGRLQPGVEIARIAAQYMVDMSKMGVSTSWDGSFMRRGTKGFFFDANPNRRTEVLAKPTFTFNVLTERDLRDSATLEGLFPSLMQQYTDAVAIYYISPQGILRYYPVVDLINKLYRINDARQEAAFTQVLPAANPDHKTVWMSAYLSNIGQGLMVTASTPVYDGNRFLGAIGVDVSLDPIVEHLNTIRPTPGGYAFLVDGDGNLVAAPPAAQTDLFGPNPPKVVAIPGTPLGLDLTTSDNAQLRSTVSEMRQGKSSVTRLSLGGKQVFLAYAPLSNVGWSLALVAPINEITAQSQTVSSSINTDAQTTVRFTLVVMTLVFLLAIGGTATFSRRLLTRPIKALVGGVQAISAGDLDVSIPVTTRDELGLLASSFNRMAGDLKKRTIDLANAGASLREREAQYRSIFESTSDGLFIYDLEGQLVDFNPAACRMYGYTSEEFRRLQPVQYIHPDSWPAFLRYIQTVRGGGQFRGQSTNVRKDGGLFYAEVIGTPFVYKGQLHTLAVVRDITEQVQAYQLLEQRVTERTRELSTLLDLSHNVASTLELEPLLGLVLDQLKNSVDYTSASIFILEGNDFVLADYQGPIPKEEWWQLPLPVEKAEIHKWVMHAREPILISDVQADTEEAAALRSALGLDQPGPSRDVRSWMWIPLRSKDWVVGGFSLDHTQPDFYSPRQARLAMAIANQAAVAIENARLYEQAQEVAALQERQRLARELHDSVSQALYGIALGARTARTLLDRSAPAGETSPLAGPLDYVLSLADAGLAEMRALIFELRPESLEVEGLVAALTKQAAALRARHGLEINADLCEEPQISLAAKEALYRIAQEAMNNVVKHAQATRVDLALLCLEHTLTLQVADNGCGFDPFGSYPGHLGLKSMRERVERLGGALQIESTAGQGTHLSAEVPLSQILAPDKEPKPG